jgi:RNA polymerase sigma-70 factor (ECF subfamily)
MSHVLRRFLIGVAAALKLWSMTATVPETDPSDEDLAEVVARRGEPDPAPRAARAAFERLYARHAPRLSAFLAARAPRDAVDDLHQEVWQRVWIAVPEHYRRENFRAWLHQIARNALVDQARKRRPEPLANEERLLDHQAGPPDAPLLEREQAEALRRCLERLDARAAALVKARLGGDTYEEIDARLGLSAAQAHKLWHKAKGLLKSCIERGSG